MTVEAIARFYVWSNAAILTGVLAWATKKAGIEGASVMVLLLAIAYFTGAVQEWRRNRAQQPTCGMKGCDEKRDHYHPHPIVVGTCKCGCSRSWHRTDLEGPAFCENCECEAYDPEGYRTVEASGE